jgi:cell division septation protein DedD
MRNGFLTGRARLSLIPVLAMGMVLVALLGGCGKKDQENADSRPIPGALLPESELNEAVGDSGSTLAVDSPPEAGTLPGAEGVRGDPAVGKQALPASRAELKAAPKEIEVAPAPAGSRPAASVSSGDSGFSLQLGSFTNLDNARKQVDRISALGYQPVIEASDLGGQTYHRVMLRDVGDMVEASRLGEYIHSELGIAYLVRRGE